MRKARKPEKNKNLRLGFYFGILVVFIIVVSLIFKIFDIVKRSEFDGNNLFTVAVISGRDAEIISVSPNEGTLKKISVLGAGSVDKLRSEGVPIDSLVETEGKISGEPNSFFPKLLLSRSSINSSLTKIDLIRLSIYSKQVDGSKIHVESLQSDSTQSTTVLGEWFIDPEIAKEKKRIEVTNNTTTSGLGNRTAKIISNMGGNVVLVNSSQNGSTKSVIYYNEDSYTVRKISRILDIPVEKRETNSISDIVVSIGEDKSDY